MQDASDEWQASMMLYLSSIVHTPSKDTAATLST